MGIFEDIGQTLVKAFNTDGGKQLASGGIASLLAGGNNVDPLIAAGEGITAQITSQQMRDLKARQKATDEADIKQKSISNALTQKALEAKIAKENRDALAAAKDKLTKSTEALLKRGTNKEGKLQKSEIELRYPEFRKLSKAYPILAQAEAEKLHTGKVQASTQVALLKQIKSSKRAKKILENKELMAQFFTKAK